MSADYGRRARIAFVFAGLTGLYPLADYLSYNCEARVQRRYEAENAAVVASLPEQYVKNTYDLPSTEDLADVGCPVVQAIPVAMTARQGQ